MHLLVSGEGPTDMGRCMVTDPCDGAEFEPGPMAWMVDQITEASLGFLSLEVGLIRYISETGLSHIAKRLRPRKLPGKRRPRETAGYYKAARALAQCARSWGEETGDEVVAVLFRDADGTQSAGRGHWQDKWDAVVTGFKVESFDAGVPMIPKPKSEAWLLCALKQNQPYQHCDAIENESGNDRSPNSLKQQLRDVLGQDVTRKLLADKVRSREVNLFRIDMPSFLAFKECLETTLGRYTEGGDGGV